MQELGDPFDQAGLLYLVRNLGDDDLVLAARQFLHLPTGADAEGPLAGRVGLDNGRPVFDQDATSRKIRAGHEADELVDGRLGILD